MKKIAVAATALILLIVAVPFACGLWKEQPFDAQRWRNAYVGAEAPPDLERRWMVRDLVSDHHLVGMTRQEVEQLLGPGGGSTGELVYDLGYDFTTNIDPEQYTLRLTLGENENVTAVRVECMSQGGVSTVDFTHPGAGC